MRYSNAFGKQSSRMVLGTTYFGDGISKEDSFALLDKFRELGGTHIDTARLYADGVAESIVGKWYHDRNATEMLICSKGGYPAADSPEVMRLSDEEIRSDLEMSLKTLGVDCIDFYWFHRDDVGIPAGHLVELMNALVKEGKIKKFGVSNWTSSRIIDAQKYAEEHGLMGFSASQIRFNPASVVNERSGLVGMDNKEFAYYKSVNMPVVAYSSQAKGFFSKVVELGIDALSDKAKLRYLFDENLNTANVLKELSVKYGCSVAAIICGAFCSFKTPEVFPIVGCSKISQLIDSMSGSDIVISDKELESIFNFDICGI